MRVPLIHPFIDGFSTKPSSHWGIPIIYEHPHIYIYTYSTDIYIYMEMSINGDTPNGWFTIENPSMDDNWGYPL
jgi:hypothetical protein